VSVVLNSILEYKAHFLAQTGRELESATISKYELTVLKEELGAKRGVPDGTTIVTIAGLRVTIV